MLASPAIVFDAQFYESHTRTDNTHDVDNNNNNNK